VDSGPTELTWGTTGICAKAAIPLLARVFPPGRSGRRLYPAHLQGLPAPGLAVRESRRETYGWHHLAPARILIALPATPVRCLEFEKPPDLSFPELHDTNNDIRLPGFVLRGEPKTIAVRDQTGQSTNQEDRFGQIARLRWLRREGPESGQ
jgi:hypothetical protein